MRVLLAYIFPVRTMYVCYRWPSWRGLKRWWDDWRLMAFCLDCGGRFRMTDYPHSCGVRRVMGELVLVGQCPRCFGK